MVKARRYFWIVSIATFALLLVLFSITFIIVPVVFKYSIGIQRALIFPTWLSGGANYSDVGSFGMRGVKNFYVNVNEQDNVTLGAWHILPIKILHDGESQLFNYERVLTSKDYDIILYLHGNGGDRSLSLELYRILRNYFQIIAIDYRGYGDSTMAEMNENNIVNDIVYFYKWVKLKTKARVYFWGHSLGTGVSTHAISKLKIENLTPAGVVLETPFTSVPDVVEHHPFVKLLSWLPWYRTTMLDSIIDNGFGFESIKYILDVDCPIMILHAKDDSVVPYEQAVELNKTVVENRNNTIQGPVSFHLFEAKGYDHMFLYAAPELPKYIEMFVKETILFEQLLRNSENKTSKTLS